MLLFKNFLSVSLLFLCTSVVASPKSDMVTKQLEQVIKDFGDAIKENDEQKFTNLFYSKNRPWLGVNAKKRKGKLPSQEGLVYASHLGFISWIATSNEQMEEKFWDIDIKTDGEIASIYFKYSFHIGDYKYNWGDEAWDLVKTADGWKIVSVIYSTTENPEPRQT